MDELRAQHKIEGLEKERKWNHFVIENSPDDSLEFATGDHESLMVIDSPDDYEDEGDFE